MSLMNWLILSGAYFRSDPGGEWSDVKASVLKAPYHPESGQKSRRRLHKGPSLNLSTVQGHRPHEKPRPFPFVVSTTRSTSASLLIVQLFSACPKLPLQGI